MIKNTPTEKGQKINYRGQILTVKSFDDCTSMSPYINVYDENGKEWIVPICDCEVVL